MDSLDWLRLGGMIAYKWPNIDFENVDIRRVESQAYIRVSIPQEEMTYHVDSKAPAEIPFETEDIEMIKWISGNQSCRVGYGSRSNKLLVSYYLDEKGEVTF